MDHELKKEEKAKQVDMSSLMVIVKASKNAVEKLKHCDPLPIFRRLCNDVLDQAGSSTSISRDRTTLVQSQFAVASRFLPPSSQAPRDVAAEYITILLDKAPQLLSIMLAVPIMWQEINILLETISDHSKSTKWNPSRSLLDALRNVEVAGGVGSKSSFQSNCVQLLKNLLPPNKSSKTGSAGTNGRGLSFVGAAKNARQAQQHVLTKRKLGEEPPIRPLSAPLLNRVGFQQHPTEPAAMRIKRGPDGQQPPMKKMKGGPTSLDSPGSSLLARMQDGPRRGGQRNPQNGGGPSGFQIKGAGATPSLQDRLDLR